MLPLSSGRALVRLARGERWLLVPGPQVNRDTALFRDWAAAPPPSGLLDKILDIHLHSPNLLISILKAEAVYTFETQQNCATDTQE
jgi:hypothetical protein